MSSKNIIFDTIPDGTKRPGRYMEFNTSAALRSLPANVQNLLLIGQRLSTGLVAELIPTQLFTTEDAANNFGSGSILDMMARAAITTYKYLNLFAIGVDDAVGSAAKIFTVTVAGTIAASGWVRLWIGDRYAQVSYAADDDASEIATNLKTAVDALDAVEGLPVSNTRASGVITFTARNKGTVANSIAITCEVSNTGGATLTYAQTTAGSGDPDIGAAGNVLDKILPGRYHVIASAFNSAAILGDVADYLTSKSGAMEMRPEVCWVGLLDTVGNAETLASGVAHERVYIASLKACKTPPFIIAASAAAADAAFSHPAMPRDEADLTAVVAPALADRYSETEVETLIQNGLTPLVVGDGESVRISRMVSTYQTNDTFLDGTTVKSLDYFRDSIDAMVDIKYQPGLMDADALTDLKEDCISVAKDLEDLKILRNVEANRDAFIVEEDLVNVGQVNAKLPAAVVPGLHVFAAQINLIL